MSLIRVFQKAHRTHPFRNRARREDGAAMIEFALSFGIFAAITFGILILCMALFCYEYVDFASREAARWALVRGSACINMPNCNADQGDIQQYVKSLNYPLIDTSKLNITATWHQVHYSSTIPAYAYWTACGSSPAGCNDPGDEVQVTIAYPFSMGIPFVGSFSPTVGSSSQMVISQ